MRAAIVTGHWPTIEQTARGVVHFFDEMKYVALRDYTAISDKEITLEDAIVSASKETGEALHAILASMLPSTIQSFDTVREIDEAIAELMTLRAKMTPAAPAKQLSRGALALV